MRRCIHTLLFGLIVWAGVATAASAWGPVAHAVIGQLAERYLLAEDARLRSLLEQFRAPEHRQQVRQALLGFNPPAPGRALRLLANWPDWRRGEPDMLPFDRRRHYVNLPQQARYQRARHCPDGICSIETLLEQRAVLADRTAPLPQRAVALAWVAHLVGDLHQPLHAGRADDRGGNLTCVIWQGEPSRLTSANRRPRCSGANLHAVWDSKLITAATGFRSHKDAPAYAKRLRRLLRPVRAAEPPLTARTAAAWRATIERWHHETHALIRLDNIYPPGNAIGPAYIRRHYRSVRLQLLRAAVRLAALLHHTLNP